MKIIKVPEKVELDVDGKVIDFTFKEFLLSAINSYEPFGQGIKNIRQGCKLAELADSAKTGEELELEDADYETLKRSVEQCKWNPFVARSAISFYDALGL